MLPWTKIDKPREKSVLRLKQPQLALRPEYVGVVEEVMLPSH
jgi:hypothetical protein